MSTLYTLLILSILAVPGDVSGFEPVRAVGARSPIEKASFLPAPRVTDEVLPGERVIGVVVKRQARAYPINMLTGPEREMINDSLGGRASAVTW